MTSRTSRFIAPQSPAEHVLRRAVIGLAREYAFARTLVNSGRLSVANPYPDSPAVTGAGWSLPNVAITLPDGSRSTLVGLAQTVGTAFIGILYAPTSGHDIAGFAQLEATGLPFRFFVCGPGGIGDPEGKLEGSAQSRARHLCPDPPRPLSRRAGAERESRAGRGVPPESALPMTTDPNIPDPDGFYAALVAAHEGLTEAQSAELNARLVFLLANQVGEQAVLLDCVAAARKPFARAG